MTAPPEEPERLARAKQWAAALDRDDFERLPEMLSPDCVYRSPKGVLTGARDIVMSYQSSSAWARHTFDSISWDSECELEPDGTVLITFVDITDHRGEQHVYRCRQRVDFDEATQIDHIEHIAIPEEEEALSAFFDRMGITRDSGSSS